MVSSRDLTLCTPLESASGLWAGRDQAFWLQAAAREHAGGAPLPVVAFPFPFAEKGAQEPWSGH